MHTQRRFPLLAFCVLLFSTWLIYGLRVLTHPTDFPTISGADGAYYTLRLKTALQGDSVISCPFDPHLKSFSTFIPSFMEASWASVLKFFVGTDVKTAITVTYLTLPVFIYSLLTLFLHLIFGNGWLALILAYWGMLEDGIYFWKPFSLGTIDLSEPLPYFRYANPQLFQIPFILAFGSFFYLVQIHEKKKERLKADSQSWLVLLVTCAIGLLFYVQIYYATYFFVFLVTFGALCVYRNNWVLARIVIVVSFGALLIGTPEIVRGMNLLVAPGILDIVHRIGLLIRNRMPYFLLHKGFLFTFVLYQYVYWNRWNTRWKVLSSAMVAGYFCLNQSVVTGLSSHDHHYFRPLMVPYVFVVADMIQSMFRRWPHWFQNKKLIILCGIIFCTVLSLKSAWFVMQLVGRNARSDLGSHYQVNLKETIERIKEIPDRNRSLLLSDPDYTYVFEIFADIPVFIDEYFYHCITSDEELFRRWAILGKTYGWNKAHVNKLLRTFVDEANVSFWLYGLPSSYQGARNSYRPQDQDLRVDTWIEAYDRSSLTDMLKFEILQESPPTYLLESRHFSADLKGLGSVFEAKLVFEVPAEGTRLWRLLPKFKP